MNLLDCLNLRISSSIKSLGGESSESSRSYVSGREVGEKAFKGSGIGCYSQVTKCRSTEKQNKVVKIDTSGKGAYFLSNFSLDS